MFRQLGLIGCGLMGGSFALALKRAGLVKHVVGYSKSPSTVITAQKMGVIDQMASNGLVHIALISDQKAKPAAAAASSAAPPAATSTAWAKP